MTPVLVDSNVILDVVTDDPTWGVWSAQTLEHGAGFGFVHRLAQDFVIQDNRCI
jgi:hypothetical protein